MQRVRRPGDRHGSVSAREPRMPQGFGPSFVRGPVSAGISLLASHPRQLGRIGDDEFAVSGPRPEGDPLEERG